MRIKTVAALILLSFGLGVGFGALLAARYTDHKKRLALPAPQNHRILLPPSKPDRPPRASSVATTNVLPQKIVLQPTKVVTKKKPVYFVTHVVDGDTFDVLIDGAVKRVRPIGIDTPETVDRRKPIECFGKEASQKATELLLNKNVRLESDPTQGDVDRYGRLLRYVYRDDGLFFNKWMIEHGFAHEYTYIVPYTFQATFKEAQRTARENREGLWASDACSP